MGSHYSRVPFLAKYNGPLCLSSGVPEQGPLLSACGICGKVQLDKTPLLKMSILGLSTMVCEEQV